jgi:transmembrane sensor
MTKSEIITLLQKHMDGDPLTVQEADLIKALTNAELEEGVFEALLSFDQEIAFDETKWDPVLQKVFLTDKVPAITQVISPVHRVHFMKKWGWAAASVVLALVITGYFWFFDRGNKAPAPTAVLDTSEIHPGKEGAILTLADGTNVSLDSVKNGVIALQGGAKARVLDGTLLYEGQGQEQLFNTMTTPKGRQFHMTLPDGTGVWLNAASSIRYPTVFTGKERRVDLTGEAYFEVAKNAKMPFRVGVGNIAEVEVLGTHFNVNAYENEASVSTTLLEGSVRVNGTTIKPGQQAQVAVGLSADSRTKSSQRIRVIDDADFDNVMAWKNGFINFEGATFDAIMRQLERWYDIQVVYENNKIPATRLAGKMTKGVSLNGLLKNLEALDVHYRLDGRKLIILQ